MIPSDTPAADILQSHTSIGFDRTAIMRDLDVTFPIERARELVAQRRLGGMATHGYSFCTHAVGVLARVLAAFGVAR